MQAQKPSIRPPGLNVIPSLEGHGELSPSAVTAAEVARVHGAIVSARQFPRDEDRFLKRLLAICREATFADEALYSLPRGGKEITGPSVDFAREALRLWGNATTSLEVLRDDAKGRKIRGRAFDLETNLDISYEDEFAKLIQRKVNDVTQWVPADEREVRELTFRRGAILVRNAILGIIPGHYKDRAIAVVEETLQAPRENLARDVQRAINAFQRVGVSKAALESYLGHSAEATTTEEIAQLKKTYRSIADGASTWADYVRSKTPAATASSEGSSARAEEPSGTLKLKTPFQPRAAAAPATERPAPTVVGDLPLELDESPIPD